MPAQVAEVLQQVRALDSGGQVETSLGDIGFTASAHDLGEDEFFGIVEAVHNNPNWFRDFELRCHSPSIRLFGKSGTGIVANSDGFEELNELDLTTDHDRAENGFNRYRHTDITEATGYVHTLIEDLHTDDGHTVTFKGIVDKTVLESELIEAFPSVLTNEVDVFLWPNPSALSNWIDDQPTNEVVDAFFTFERLPVFFFENEVPTTLDASVITSLTELDGLDGEAIAECRDLYQETMQLARRGTVWRDELSPVPPAAIIPLVDTIPGFEPVLVYSIFGVFSTTVEPIDGLPRFTITAEPMSYEKRVDPRQVSQGYTQSDIDQLVQAYQIFSEHQDKAAFRDFWRLAIANTCDDLLDIPDNVSQIQGYYEDLQVDAIEENFDDLSDAIQQIHSFMTGITNRVSDAATQLSRQIQTLLFTLIGTVIANLFLVLRWNNVTYVPPFSLFILIVLIGFYFPLIQDRISDLSNIRREVEKDYTLYESEIRRFSEQIFDFEELSGRKDSYLGMAERKEKWAQDRLDLIFKLLVVVWTGLAVWSFIAYPVVSMQIAVGILSLVALLVISYFHSGKDYFASRYVTGCEIIGITVFGVRLLLEFDVL